MKTYLVSLVFHFRVHGFGCVRHQNKFPSELRRYEPPSHMGNSELKYQRLFLFCAERI